MTPTVFIKIEIVQVQVSSTVDDSNKWQKWLKSWFKDPTILTHLAQLLAAGWKYIQRKLNKKGPKLQLIFATEKDSSNGQAGYRQVAAAKVLTSGTLKLSAAAAARLGLGWCMYTGRLTGTVLAWTWHWTWTLSWTGAVWCQPADSHSTNYLHL